MDPILIFSHHFWLFAIAGTFFQVFQTKKRIKKYIQAKPELEPGYNSLLRGMFFWFNVPWVVMGIGMLSGRVPTMLHFFRPRDGNPFVSAWFATVIALWLLGTFWLVAKKGAEKLVEYPGFLTTEVKTPKQVLVTWFLSLLGGIVGVVMMWVMNVPIPKSFY